MYGEGSEDRSSGAMAPLIRSSAASESDNETPPEANVRVTPSERTSAGFVPFKVRNRSPVLVSAKARDTSSNGRESARPHQAEIATPRVPPSSPRLEAGGHAL